jgi:hypothetical protein
MVYSLLFFLENQLLYMEYISQELNIEEPDAWNSITKAKLCKVGASMILERYGDFISKMLCSLYPEYPWKVWLFLDGRVPQGFWDAIENQRHYLDWLGKQLNIHSNDDWYPIKREQVLSYGGASLLTK